MEEKKRNNKIILAVIGIIMILGIIGGVTYAYFSAQANTETQTITTAKLDIGFTNGDIIRAIDIEPIDDVDIKTKATELPFSVTNTGNKHTNITIKLTDIVIAEELKDIDFRWGLYNADTDNGLAFGIFKNIGNSKEMTIYKDTIIEAADPDITKNYILRIWIHDNGALQNELQEKTFSAKVQVTGEIVEYTPEECFTFDSDFGVINGYSNDCPKDVVIPKTINGVTVTEIGEDAFGDSEMLISSEITSVIIPDSVIYIGTEAFYLNPLTHITIPENVEGFGQMSICEMYNLKSIFIPENVNSIENAFCNTKLTELVIPGSVTIIDDFYGSPISSIVLMNGINKISSIGGGDYVNTSFNTIEIPSSVTSIESGVFSNAQYLTEVEVRGKNSLNDFTESAGLTTEGGLPSNAKIIFRP